MQRVGGKTRTMTRLGLKHKILLNKLVIEIGELLTLYIRVQNQRAKEAETVSSMFRKVNFKGIYITTQIVVKQCEEKERKLNSIKNAEYQCFSSFGKELFDCLYSYFSALHKSSKALSEISLRQYLRSENKQELSFTENKRLHKEHSKSIDQYLALAGKLNKLHSRLATELGTDMAVLDNKLEKSVDLTEDLDDKTYKRYQEIIDNSYYTIKH